LDTRQSFVTRVAILPIPTEAGVVSYCAVAGEKHPHGRTAGEALDATQQQRLAELMGAWRSSRDRGEAFSADEQLELRSLVEAELQASVRRAVTVADELGR
jgi:hypothetical protein